MKVKFILFSVISMILGCSYNDNSINLIGKSREEVINFLDTHSRYCYEDYGGMQNKIRISVNSVNKYYDSIDEIRKDAFIMNNNKWEIMFKKTFLGESFFEIVFNENDIVISQKSFSLRDGP